ncbi:MAG: MBL fold metallo-hydrolase [Chthoniobacterales bacterium]
MELFVLGSGSSGNTAILRAGENTVMIDAGLGPRKTLARLQAAGISPAEIQAVLLTHEHGDHAGGLPALLGKLGCPVYATRLTAEEVRGQDPRNQTAPWRIFSSGSTFTVGSLEITAFSVPHDAADPVGFTIRSATASLAVITDLGHVNHSVIHHVTGVNCLFVEANHDEDLLHRDTRRPLSIKQRIRSPHGHLSNKSAAELASRSATTALRRVVLGHLSRDCNEPLLAVSVVRAALAAYNDVEVLAAGENETLTVRGFGAVL